MLLHSILCRLRAGYCRKGYSQKSASLAIPASFLFLNAQSRLHGKWPLAHAATAFSCAFFLESQSSTPKLGMRIERLDCAIFFLSGISGVYFLPGPLCSPFP